MSPESNAISDNSMSFKQNTPQPVPCIISFRKILALKMQGTPADKFQRVYAKVEGRE